MDMKRNASIALIVILLACTIAIVAFTMSNGSTPVGPPTPTANQPTPTPNVISPYIASIGGARWITPGWLLNSSSNTPSLTNDVMYLFPVRIPYNQTWTSIAVGVNTAATNGIGRVCIYTLETNPDSISGLSPGDLAHDFGTFTATTTGTKTIVDIFSPDINTGGFYFFGVVPRGDTDLVMRNINTFDAVMSPVTAYGSAGGPLRQFGLLTDPDTDFIDIGCPADINPLLTGFVGSGGFPNVWVLEN